MAVRCNVPEAGVCYYEGVVISCEQCDQENTTDQASTDGPAALQPAYSPYGGIDTTKNGGGGGFGGGTPVASGCKLVRVGWWYQWQCPKADDSKTKSADAKKDSNKKGSSQGESFLRAATADMMGATLKLGEGDSAGASAILLHADEALLNARRAGLPSELDLEYLNQEGMKALSGQFAQKSGLSPVRAAASVANAAASRDKVSASQSMQGLLKEMQDGDLRSKAERALAQGELHLRGDPAPQAPAGGGSPAMSYSHAKDFFAQAGGNFEVSTASPVPAGPSIPKRTFSTLESDRQELSELRSMIRSASLQRIGREPASADDNVTLFLRVSKRIRVLTPELAKKP